VYLRTYEAVQYTHKHYIAYNGINIQPPNFIFIDIDNSLFKTDEELWIAAEKTCKNIEQTLGGRSTVLWSGNGVHIYVNQCKQ
jgi:hypothetical protein